MNLTNICPDIPDNWCGGITDTCKILGKEKPLSSSTLRKYVKDGGIAYTVSHGGRKMFSGKEIKRFWNTYSCGNLKCHWTKRTVKLKGI